MRKFMRANYSSKKLTHKKFKKRFEENKNATRIFAIILLALIFFTSYGETKKNSTIKTLTAYVKEESLFEKNSTIKTEYDMQISFPDKLKKIMQRPELNRGEIYIYIGNKRTTYLPFFGKKVVEDLNKDELTTVNFVQELMKVEMKKDLEVTVTEKEKVVVKEVKEVDGYLLPTKIEIYSEDIKISTLEFFSIKVNAIFPAGVFEVADETDSE
ncbi:MAG: hypothetical protein ACRCSK_03160 [Fusobacteriaceae bacterium]